VILATKLVLIGLYLASVYWLSWLGMKKATTASGFAIGNRDMGPIFVGIVMAASIASTATFVINPGFVYTHGLSALLHYGVAAQAGVAFGLLAVCKGFRKLGEAHGCLTIPDWIRVRYGSPRLASAFAWLNLLSIAFVVLILVGCAMLLAALLDISYLVALVAVLGVVFSYVLLGGAYAHAYTNVVQCGMMVAVAVALFVSGLHHFDGGFLHALRSVSPSWAAPVNPDSDLYGSVFAVFVSAFVVTFALMLQPHVLTKALYLRSEKDMRRFIATTVVIGLLFGLCLFVGVYARLDGAEHTLARQDRVVTDYVLAVFGGGTGGEMIAAVMVVTLLAAGMSTLDGILVAIAAVVSHDLVMRGKANDDPKKGLLASRVALVGVGLASFVLAIDPPQLVGLFAQRGVYALAAASFVPIVFGVLVRGHVPAMLVAIAAGTGVVVHLVLPLVAHVPNPAVSATWAILASTMVGLVGLLAVRASAPRAVVEIQEVQ
jgi:SSS family solute:Na+ symporter/sodium/pantothenate symporter